MMEEQKKREQNGKKRHEASFNEQIGPVFHFVTHFFFLALYSSLWLLLL